LRFYSFIRSWAERIIDLRDRSMIIPGPMVQGPPNVKIILGGSGQTSAMEIAMLSAWPKERELR
jgi:hypothetical protein